MTNVNPADNKRKLSKNLREMKFMQRGAVRQEIELQKAEEKESIDNEHWVLSRPDLPDQPDLLRYELSHVACRQLMFGRRSYKGFNPEIEKLCKAMDAEGDAKSDDPEDDNEKTIDDVEMAETYGSLTGTIARRFMKRKQRSAIDEIDSSSDVEVIVKDKSKKNKKFLKPCLDDL